MSSVPPCASSNTPRLASVAPVKAPRSCPKSALSTRFGGTAVQSNTANGPPARGPISWRLSASTSLPVPVSPSITTVASEAAIFSSCENTSRICAEAPTSEPKRVRCEVAINVSAVSTSIRSCEWPSTSTAPPGTVASVMPMPETEVPLRLPRSLTRTTPPAIASSQWKRDTVGSSITRSFDGCEPIAQRSAVWAHAAPVAGPAVTVTRNRRIARRLSPSVGRVTTGSGAMPRR
jgi:hypothetical protein